jgi:hypothetical protein
MSLPRLTSLLMVAVVAAACDSDSIEPPFGLGYAAATLECVGPLSESGVAIYLANAPVESAEPPEPYVRLIIREPLLERLSGRTWVVAGSEAHAAARGFSTTGEFEVATRGTVTVNSVAADNTIEGWADLTFPRAGRLGGNFQARWLPRVQLCL